MDAHQCGTTDDILFFFTNKKNMSIKLHRLCTFIISVKPFYNIAIKFD